MSHDFAAENQNFSQDCSQTYSQAECRGGGVHAVASGTAESKQDDPAILSAERMEGDMSETQASEAWQAEAERFASTMADKIEERRNEREKETSARNEKLAFLRETLEATIKQFEDVKDGYARIEAVTLDDAWAEFKIKMYAIAAAA